MTRQVLSRRQFIGPQHLQTSPGDTINNMLKNSMLPTLSTELLGRMAERRTFVSIRITDAEGELAYEFVHAEADSVSAEVVGKSHAEPELIAEQVRARSEAERAGMGV